MSRNFLLLALAVAPVSAQVTVTVPVPPITVTTPMMTTNLDMRYNLDLAQSLSGWRENQLAFTSSLDDFRYETSHLTSTLANLSHSFGSEMPRAAWQKDDPADSLYRAARESLNRGDYRRAASQFDDIAKRFPKSVYVKDAPYWRAFSLYRIGGTAELTEALAVLDKWRTDNPAPANKSAESSDRRLASSTGFTSVWSDGNRPDVDGLSARIAGVLASRGMSENAAVKRALAARGDACDSEDQSVKAEALSAVMQSNAELGRASAAKILARRDDCSVPLRRNALLILASKHDGSSTATLISTAKDDPSMSLRQEGIRLLGRESGDDALNALDQLARSTDANVQRYAIQAMGSSPNPRAKAMLRSLVERTETSESARLSAIDGFSKESTSADDAAWLRGYYPRATLRVQERIASVVGNVGGDANDQWLMALVRNEEAPTSVRASILNRMGRTMDIATLSKFYDTAPNRNMRESVISLLSNRAEPAAVDKLIDIAKNGTDPNMRRTAISALARSKDPRAAKLLLELVDK